MINNDPPVAVITGAASGLGLELSRIYLSKPYRVVMVDVDKAALDTQSTELALQSPNQILSKICDVSDHQAVLQLSEEVFDVFGRVDCLFNNAGVCGPMGPVWSLPLDQIQQVLSVNVNGILHGIQAFIPRMLEQPFRSRIVNMASVYGLCSSAQIAPYTMSKHAVVALSESLYFDLKRLSQPVDVSVVCPSFVNTSLLRDNKGNKEDPIQVLMSKYLKISADASEVAMEIVKQIDEGYFYVLPDKEVGRMASQRTEAVCDQALPFVHPLEKLMEGLCQKTSR